MSVNHSSFSNNSCSQNVAGWFTEHALAVTNILFLLPVSIFVLHLGVQRWKQQRSVSSAAVVSHSDFLTYNIAIMEIIGILGNIIRFAGIYSRQIVMMVGGFFIGVFPWYGQMVFPILTCVERYLAVVHPVTYLRLKQGGGVRIRNISVVSVWLVCLGSSCFIFVDKRHFQSLFVANSVEMTFFLIVMVYCSVSVLCVLIRPRPGDRVRVDQSKRRSFFTIMIIMGVLVVKFGGNVVSFMLAGSPVNESTCFVLLLLPGWFNLPSSLVLPLLFLHRAGKLPGCKTKAAE